MKRVAAAVIAIAALLAPAYAAAPVQLVTVRLHNPDGSLKQIFLARAPLSITMQSGVLMIDVQGR